MVLTWDDVEDCDLCGEPKVGPYHVCHAIETDAIDEYTRRIAEDP